MKEKPLPAPPLPQELKSPQPTKRANEIPSDAFTNPLHSRFYFSAFVEQSEPFVIQSILNEVARTDFRTGSAYLVDQILTGVPLGASLFGIDKKLQNISDGLQASAELGKYALKPGGGFNWRVIAGTTQLSEHSFGIALDINVGYSDYWRWAKPGKDGTIPYKNRIPLAIASRNAIPNPSPVDGMTKRSAMW